MMKTLLVSFLLVGSFAIAAETEAIATTTEVTTEKLATTQLATTQLATTQLPSQSSAAEPTEDQIPLKIEQYDKAQVAGGQSSKLALTLLVLAGMISAGYYFIRKYSFSNKINKSNTQIKILAQHHLGPKKSLAIIRVAGESVLIGVTEQNISMIKSLSLIDDEIPAAANLPQTFAQTMTAAPETLAEEIEDEFSFSGIKTNVAQKLKSMRNIQ